MITQNKLSNQPENKLTTKFQPIDIGEEDYIDIGDKKRKLNHGGRKKGDKKKDGRKSKKMMIFLPLLLIVVAGATFGIIWLVAPKNSTKNDDVPEESFVDDFVEETLPENPEPSPEEEAEPADPAAESILPITNAPSSNPTIKYGKLMLINPNFTVDSDFISARREELVSLQNTYGISELNSYNGDNLLDIEAARAINQMLADYTIFNPGHTMQTVSCFRSVGTNCGRLCAATGASDHHTGLTCDLIDPVYGTSLDTSAYEKHLEWQWLKANSYKYGFIDRFPEAWAGGSMDEPLNVNAEGSTGLFETWHYRYVGVFAATEIATGVYNNGEYDSLEHYLKARGLVTNLLNN